MKAGSACAKGRGSRRIPRDLGQKGVDCTATRMALLWAAREVIDISDEKAETTAVLHAAKQKAAETFARTKRLGPYRSEPLQEHWTERSKIWRREAGAMAQAGFGVDTICQVLGQETEEVYPMNREN